MTHFQITPIKRLIFACVLWTAVFSTTDYQLAAQTFNGQGNLLIPPGAPFQTVGITISPAVVTGVGELGTGCKFIGNVTMDVEHTWTGDIAIFLIAPSGEVLEFSTGNGGSGDDFSITVFTDVTSLFITQGAPPFNGLFKPEGRLINTTPPYPNTNPLGAYTFLNTFNGINADGEWSLYINDYIGGDVGIINSWSITFVDGVGPAPEVTLGPDVSICAGETTTLTAVVDPDADSYEWSTGETTPSINVAPTVTTTYIVTVNNGGCLDRDTISVIVSSNGGNGDAGPDVGICQFQSTTLTGAGGGPGATYAWSSGQTGQMITVNPGVTTTYTLTVTDGGCVSTDQVVVTVTPIPIANAGPDIEICESAFTLLQASGGFQNSDYTWSTGQTGSSITVNPSATTLYFVRVTVNGCFDEDEVLVTVVDAPIVDAGPPQEICAGEDVTLIATGDPGVYEWSNGFFGNEISVSPAVTTTYTVTLTDAGCEAIDNVTVEVINVQANAGANQSVCEGESAVLTASGGNTYEWSTGESQSSISVVPSNTTTYFVTVSDGNCADIASVEVEVVDNPIAAVTPEQTICEGETVTLTASGGTEYIWNTGQTTPAILVTPDNTTTYSVTVSAQGCEATASTTVFVNPFTIISAGPDQQICDDGSAILTASGLSGSGEYVWSTGETGEEITVEPLSITVYSVTATNEFDCSSTAAVTVEVNPIPIANAGSDQELCEDSEATLTASGGTSNAIFLWSTGQTGQTIIVSPGTTTIYTVTVEDAGCSDTDDVEITVLAIPTASAGTDEELCSGAVTELEASGGSSYAWSNGQTTELISVTPLITTVYTVTVTSANGCTASDAVTVEINPLPLANAGPDQNICEGEVAILSGSGGGSYDWSTGENTASINVSPSVTNSYILTITDAVGCSATDIVAVFVQPLPVASAGPNQFLFAGESAVLTATGGGTYTWNTGETSSQITVMPTVTTTYTVTVTIGGCISIDEVTVFVDEVPTVDLGPDLEICAGESITLNALITGPFTLTYLWSTGETSSSIQVAPLLSTNYSVSVTNTQSGLFSLDTIQVMVNQIPIGTPVISGSGSICSGDVATYFVLSVAGASVYQWNVTPNGIIQSGQGTQQIGVQWNVPGPGEVQLIVSNDCGALPAVLFDQPIDDIPVAPGPLTGNPNPCAAGSSQYSIPAIINATSYQWSLTGGGVIQSGQGTASVDIAWNNTAGGDLCVVAINACGSSPSVCIPIQTVATPVLSAGPDLSACNQNIILQGSGFGSWTLVSGPGDAIFNTPDDPGSLVTVDQSGIYSFSYSFDQNGCSATDQTQVRFFETPAIINLSTLCADALTDYAVSFDIQGGQEPYMVNGSIIGGNAYVSGAIVAGSPYSFQVIDANGCISATVTGLQECNCITNVGQMSPDPVEVCAGEEISLIYLGGDIKDADDTLAFILHDGNIPDGIIAWRRDPLFDFISTLVTGQTYFVSAILGNADINGLPDLTDPCLSVSNATPVVFNPLPVALTAETSTLGCDPQTVTLAIGLSATGSNISYRWSAFGGGEIEGPVDGISVDATEPGSYILTVEQVETGCEAADTIDVMQASLSIDGLSFTTTGPLCPGNCNGEVLITAAQPQWSFDFGNGIVTPDLLFTSACSGGGQLTVVDALGCRADTLYDISEPIAIEVNLGPDQTISFGETLMLSADTDAEVVLYNWFGADSCTLCPSILVQPMTSSSFQVQILDMNGCTATDEINVTLSGSNDIYIPNVFSPNNDQINDIFFIEFNPRIKNVERVEIFDRWGNLVFSKSDFLPGDINDGWDGAFREKILNPGVFTYRAVIQFLDDDAVMKTGTLTLVR